MSTPSDTRSQTPRGLWSAVRGSLVLLLLALASGPAMAQTTGQLSGVIRDAQSGETIIGASVRVDGTTQGASTNIDGEYRIIGVRPGTYTLIASYIGYAPTRVEGVRVNVDLT
ncbi:MAG: carboxypeptidase-like regulatory domain-containing protein, partial [Bacteroidota bacterium]